MGQSKEQIARRFMLLFGLVFLLGGALAGYVAASETLHSLRLTQQGHRAEAVVIDYPWVRWGSGARGSGNMVRLQFTARDGQKVVFQTRPRVPRGTHPVLYMAGDPQDARIDSFQALWFWAALGSAIAAALLLVGGSILSRGLRRW